MKKLIALIIISFVIFIGIFTFYNVLNLSDKFKKSEAFQTVFEKIINNKTNIPVSDGKVEISYIVGGKLNSKIANFHFKVYTLEKKFVVYADLIKNDFDKWEVLDFEAIEK